MSDYGYLLQAISTKSGDSTHDQFTIGRVVDTNDPQQMGRVRAFCPAYGDKTEFTIDQLPWAMFVSPLGGITSMGTRGAEKSPSTGPVAYGMWGIPKVGAYVLVGCVDGDKSLRFYAGCIHPQYMTHTMPHGRYTWSDKTDEDTHVPDGPLDTLENPIQPLYGNMETQFTFDPDPNRNYAGGTSETKPHKNMEWRTRGADNQVSAITNLHVLHDEDGPGSEVADHEWGKVDFTTVTEEDGSQRVIRGPGYGVDQQDPDATYSHTVFNYDSMIYSWTTPGFHSFSMDDRDDNSRIRIRTTSGHQIIMDDTNERIYINTAGGESWIELDKVGNIDIYASKDISTHAGGDINFTADGTFRVQATQGIHMMSGDQVRIHSKEGESGEGIHIKSDTNIHIEAGGVTHVTVGSTLFITSGEEMHHLSGGTMFFTGGSDIHLNGPPATAADTANESFIASRIPEHEPWARVYSDVGSADNDTNNMFVATSNNNYKDPSVGKVKRDGTPYDPPRNSKWHR